MGQFRRCANSARNGGWVLRNRRSGTLLISIYTQICWLGVKILVSPRKDWSITVADAGFGVR